MIFKEYLLKGSKMKKLFKIGIMLTLLAFMFTGCRTGALVNINDASFVPMDTQKLTMDNVGRSIIRAGATLGWQMKKVSDGEIVGTLYLRDHMAQVKIPYTTKSYSIVYQNSSNLKYDADNNTIHSNYNGWVKNLDRAIQIQLGLL